MRACKKDKGSVTGMERAGSSIEIYTILQWRSYASVATAAHVASMSFNNNMRRIWINQFVTIPFYPLHYRNV